MSLPVRANSSRLFRILFPQYLQFRQRFRMPSTTLAGALARNCSFSNCRCAIGSLFLDLLQFLCEALPFRGHVNLLFVNYVDIESRRERAPAIWDNEFSTKVTPATPASRSMAP